MKIFSDDGQNRKASRHSLLRVLGLYTAPNMRHQINMETPGINKDTKRR